ncbi:hypothetical protein [Chromohalobacter canadensis]|uniref:hypothetical protein n=1 Tax=Chromohalobacter canadensis TaxID=141389 RepID=UPI0024106317|nr:hypothetical protein [Chromohalobacter canadensis]
MIATSLLLAAAIVAGLRIGYQVGKADGFIEGLQVMEEAECGRIVGTVSDQKDERKP